MHSSGICRAEVKILPVMGRPRNPLDCFVPSRGYGQLEFRTVHAVVARQVRKCPCNCESPLFAGFSDGTRIPGLPQGLQIPQRLGAVGPFCLNLRPTLTLLADALRPLA